MQYSSFNKLYCAPECFKPNISPTLTPANFQTLLRSSVSKASIGSSGECPKADSTFDDRFFFLIISTNFCLTMFLISGSCTSSRRPDKATKAKLERSGVYFSTSTVTEGFCLKCCNFFPYFVDRKYMNLPSKMYKNGAI